MIDLSSTVLPWLPANARFRARSEHRAQFFPANTSCILKLKPSRLLFSSPPASLPSPRFHKVRLFANYHYNPYNRYSLTFPHLWLKNQVFLGNFS